MTEIDTPGPDVSPAEEPTPGEGVPPVADPATDPSVLGARPSDEALAALPSKARVHAVARVVGLSSRELLAVLARLGVGARSAQSSLDAASVQLVVDDLYGSVAGDEPAVAEAPPAPAPEEPAPSASRSAPVVAPPTFLAPGAAGSGRETGGRRGAGRDGAGRDGAGRDGAGRDGAASTGAADSADTADSAEGTTEAAPSRSRRRRGSRSSGPVAPAEDESTTSTSDTDATTTAGPDAETTEAGDASGTGDPGDDDSGDTDDDGGRRRRRRGRRGRGRGRGPADEGDEGSDDGDQDSDDEGSESGDESDGDDAGDDGDEQSSSGSRRRRRRRRRSAESGDGSSGEEGDDPPNTVTHVRERAERSEKTDRSDRVERPERSSNDEVKGVKGSTRLEAKRQRRRDGRDGGRRRPAILSESEFLARREAVERTMVVRQQADRSQIGVLEDGVLVEHFVAGEGQHSMVGNVYLGRVQNVLPSMEAAFVDIGRGRNAVLYAGEVNWDASGLEGKQRKIEQALSSGDQVLVQVTKDPVGHKGARLTTQLSLPGRFLVFVPGGGATGISRKLPENERKRLKEILKRIVPDESGVIIRTAAEGVSEEDLERDVRRLTAQWEAIDKSATQAKNAKGTAPTLVYEEPDLLIRVVRDMFNEDFSSLVISGERAWETLEGYITHVAPELAPRLSRHVAPQDVFAAYRIDEQITKALDRKVWLPSGGTLVIDRTEAMTVIDVNTGKFTGSGGNLEETVTRNNLEAAEEVVRQLRLRDIGGMIVVDFIDMVLESNRDLVLRRLTECLGRDRTRHQVSEVTSLGLVQMTRKRVGQGLLDEFSTTCEHCRGRGVIVSTEPVADHQHGSGSNGHAETASAGSGSNGSGSNGAGSHGSNGAGSHGSNGSNGNGGGGNGRRRGRGRRSAQAEAGPPSPEVDDTSPVTTLAPTEDMRRSSAAAVAAMAGSTGVATAHATDASSSGEAVSEAAVSEDAVSEDAVSEAAVSEAAVSEDAVSEAAVVEAAVAEESTTAGSDTVETPADEATVEVTASEETPADVAVEPEVALEADLALEADVPAHETAPASPQAEPEPEPAPTGRPRRRRAASRPAGPPAGGADGAPAAAGSD